VEEWGKLARSVSVGMEVGKEGFIDEGGRDVVKGRERDEEDGSG